MNAIAKMGHNRSAYELAKERIEGLYEEAHNWLDGEEIASQDQADAVQKLMRQIQDAEKEADTARKDEAKPHDDAKAEIQERYNALIGKTKSVTGLTVRAIDACKKALAPWLIKVDEENKRKAEAAAKEAEEKRLAAMKAMQERQSLQDSEEAERLVKESHEADKIARAAANAKASARGEGRAVTLRDVYTPEITDYTAFARYVWLSHPQDMKTFLGGFAASLVASGIREIPGVTVHHERRAQ